MTKEETDQKNMANLRAYLNGLGMPKEDRDALPFGTTRTDLLSYAKGYEDAKREAKEVAEDGGWISVDDRLPDVDQDVLLLTGSGIIEGSRTNGDYGDWNFITLNFHGCGCCSGDSDEVSHWQPLPSEPKTT
jgi:hypothetical protein